MSNYDWRCHWSCGFTLQIFGKNGLLYAASSNRGLIILLLDIHLLKTYVVCYCEKKHKQNFYLSILVIISGNLNGCTWKIWLVQCYIKLHYNRFYTTIRLHKISLEQCCIVFCFCLIFSNTLTLYHLWGVAHCTSPSVPCPLFHFISN